ncbi:MAG: ribose 5-phosphate isomerase B [Candidatus Omnitrophica bacterium]|nr:ribose 5-phosphate isomerase B [Candidatus Omnitrophota bacterium]
MKIFIGADHRGVNFKKKITQILEAQGLNVIDLGSYDPVKSCDYPKVARKVAREVSKSRNARGILVCMSGIGQAIAANKVRGAYAALCYNTEAAALSRRHNNANILVLGSKFVKPKDVENILRIWLNTKFEGGRHRRRVDQIKKMERGVKI